MNFQKYKTTKRCVGQKHYSGKKNNKFEITFNKTTGKEIKLLVGQCVICNRRKSLIVSDNTIQAEGRNNFFKKLGKIAAKAGKKLATNVLKNPGGALDNIANTATAVGSWKPKASYFSTLPENISFITPKRGFTLAKLIKLCYINGQKM